VIDGDELEGSRAWAAASLRIASDELHAESIGELLDLHPTSTREAEGEPAFTVWMVDSGIEPSAPIEDHLYILLEKLRGRRDAIVDLCQRAAVEIWLSYSLGDGHARTAVFNHAALAELGDLGIDLVLDPYPAGRRAQL